MRAIHRAFCGKEPHFVRLPLGPIRALLALIEPLLRPVLPVTAGQLAMFANDSTASPNWLHDRLKGRMRSTEEAIATLVAKELQWVRRRQRAQPPLHQASGR